MEILFIVGHVKCYTLVHSINCDKGTHVGMSKLNLLLAVICTFDIEINL